MMNSKRIKPYYADKLSRVRSMEINSPGSRTRSRAGSSALRVSDEIGKNADCATTGAFTYMFNPNISGAYDLGIFTDSLDED